MSGHPGHSTARDWFWPVLVMLMIFVASSQSHVAGPPIAGFDKVAHFFAYGLLGTLLARVPALARSAPLGLFAAVALASLYGVTDEFHQSFTPGRSVDVLDWLADTGGASLAVSTYRLWPAYRRLLETAPAHARVDLPAAGSPD